MTLFNLTSFELMLTDPVRSFQFVGVKVLFYFVETPLYSNKEMVEIPQINTIHSCALEQLDIHGEPFL